jgi:hypothetical protein
MRIVAVIAMQIHRLEKKFSRQSEPARIAGASIEMVRENGTNLKKKSAASATKYRGLALLITHLARRGHLN